MKHIKTFEQMDYEEVDIDYVLDKMKSEHGWGDIYLYVPEFEASDYYSGTTDNDEYLEEFHKYMTDYQFGRINTEDEEE